MRNKNAPFVLRSAASVLLRYNNHKSDKLILTWPECLLHPLQDEGTKEALVLGRGETDKKSGDGDEKSFV